MISTILGWLGGGAISSIGEHLTRAYEAKIAASNNAQRIKADKLIAQLEARREVLLAEQRSWLTAWIRPLFALPFVIYLWKIIVWDRVLGLGTTHDLSQTQYQLMMIVFGAYFLTRGIERVVGHKRGAA